MIPLALILLGQVAPCPPGTVCPAPAISTAAPLATTNSPQWIWVTNESRYGWGTINANGYFVEQPQPVAPVPAPVPAPTAPQPVPIPSPKPSPGALPTIGGLPNYGVDLVAMHEAATRPSSFTSNDPNFHPPSLEQQVPLPTPGEKQSGPRPFVVLGGMLTGLLGLLGFIEWRQRHHAVDH